jgi:alpha/beta superfamily hydrolase
VAFLQLLTSDGHRLDADIEAGASPVRAGAVLCHPHPLYGGDRFNTMVDALVRQLPPLGITALRFDFRAAHDHGRGEQLDVVAALDALDADAVPGPRFVAGYSFGARVALSTIDPRIAAVVAIAAPLTDDVAPPSVPTLLIVPEHDQFCPPQRAAEVTAEWPDATLAGIAGADHFLGGHTADIAARAGAWLAGRAGG